MEKKRLEWFSDSVPLGRPMGAVTKTYFGALSKNIELLGIDRHFTMLVVLYSADKKYTQQCLSNILNIDKVSMVRMLDYLFSKNMITRVVNPDDRREHIIELTPKAKKIMPGVLERIKEMNSLAFKGVSKSEQQIFQKVVLSILKNMEDLPVNKVDIKLKKK